MKCEECPLRKTKWCSDRGCGIDIINATLEKGTRKPTTNKQMVPCSECGDENAKAYLCNKCFAKVGEHLKAQHH